MTWNNFKTGKSCYCIKNSYKESIMVSSEKFSVDEYEVFKITERYDSPLAFKRIKLSDSPTFGDIII